MAKLLYENLQQKQSITSPSIPPQFCEMDTGGVVHFTLVNTMMNHGGVYFNLVNKIMNYDGVYFTVVNNENECWCIRYLGK